MLRKAVGVAGMAAAGLVLAGLTLPAGAAADGGTCAVVGADVVCTFEFTGAEQTYDVPPSVTSLHVLAQGASAPYEGGQGAAVTGELTVTGGDTLYVEVGGAPYDPDACYHSNPCRGGFNGGGYGGYKGIGGAGASDVRTQAAGQDASLASRLIVAAGGGGPGLYGYCSADLVNGGAGGDAGQAGQDGQPCASGEAGGAGGGAGTQSAGGTGGGMAGSLGTGGNGAYSEGGGGGGLYGGASGELGAGGGSGGGGGGSSLGTTNGLADVSKVVISYALPVPALSTVAPSLVKLGGQSADSATIAGLVDPIAGSTVDFRLYGPDDGDCSGPPVFESLDRPVALAGATGSATSAPFTPATPGSYRWIASFGGDDHNAAVSGSCDDSAELVTVPTPEEEPPPGSTASPPGSTAASCPAGTTPTVRCERDAKGRLAMTGTEADETFEGTEGPDRISPHGGEDTVHGNGGDDLISGGPGDDELHGGPGDDRLNGNQGNDRIAGEGGDDSMSGEAGNDSIAGQTGADGLAGGPGDDIVVGGPGRDFMRGHSGDDSLDGGSGRDVLSGGTGGDTLDGGPDADQLRCGPGADTTHDAAQDRLSADCAP